MDVPQAARIGRPPWVNARTVLGLVLFSLSFFLGRQILHRAETATPLWAAARDLAQETRLRDGDLVPVDVRLPPGAASSYLSTSEVVEGALLAQPVRAGELIPASTVVPAAEVSARAVAVPVTADHAVGGQLRIGDRVDVFATFDSAGARARTTLVVRAAPIIGIMSAGGLVGGEETMVGVTVSASPIDSARLIFALRAGELDIVRVSPGGGDERIPPVTERDLR